jgi:signal transduction histidine kinase
LLLDGYAEQLTDKQKVFLERAYESNERQLHIVQEILKISQLDLQTVVLKLDLHDVRDIAKEAADSLQSNLKKRNQKLIFELPRQPVFANVDADQIRVAIENLLENASNYTWKDKTITLGVVQTKDKIKIAVKDQGVGIDKADFRHLFQKFSRVPNALSVETGGTGLGLYWASKIVELHSGTIEVKSDPGKGSRFSIVLPR